MNKLRVNLTCMGPASDWRDEQAGKRRYRAIWDCPRCQSACRTMLTGKKEEIEELIRSGWCPRCKPQ